METSLEEKRQQETVLRQEHQKEIEVLKEQQERQLTEQRVQLGVMETDALQRSTDQQAEADALQQQLQQLKEQLEQKEGAIEAIQWKIEEDLGGDPGAAIDAFLERTTATLKADLADAQRQNALLSESVESTVAEAQAIQQRSDTLANRLDEITSDLTAANETIVELRAQVEQRSAQSMSKDREVLKQVHQLLQADDIDDPEATMEAMQSLPEQPISFASAQPADLSEQLQPYLSESDQQAEQINVKSIIDRQIEIALSEQQEDMDALNEQLHKLHRKIQEHKVEAATVQELVVALRERNTELEADNQQLHGNVCFC